MARFASDDAKNFYRYLPNPDNGGAKEVWYGVRLFDADEKEHIQKAMDALQKKHVRCRKFTIPASGRMNCGHDLPARVVIYVPYSVLKEKAFAVSRWVYGAA
jgi:hypothetical protein